MPTENFIHSLHALISYYRPKTVLITDEQKTILKTKYTCDEWESLLGARRDRIRIHGAEIVFSPEPRSSGVLDLTGDQLRFDPDATEET